MTRTVLVVDDEPDLRSLMKMSLELVGGYACTALSNASRTPTATESPTPAYTPRCSSSASTTDSYQPACPTSATPPIPAHCTEPPSPTSTPSTPSLTAAASSPKPDPTDTNLTQNSGSAGPSLLVVPVGCLRWVDRAALRVPLPRVALIPLHGQHIAAAGAGAGSLARRHLC